MRELFDQRLDILAADEVEFQIDFRGFGDQFRIVHRLRRAVAQRGRDGRRASPGGTNSGRPIQLREKISSRTWRSAGFLTKSRHQRHVGQIRVLVERDLENYFSASRRRAGPLP